MNAVETIENALAYYTVGAAHGNAQDVRDHNAKIAHALEWLHAQWVPVPDGYIALDKEAGESVATRREGSLLVTTDGDQRAIVLLPDNLRLCRKVNP